MNTQIEKPVNILRDTGALLLLILDSISPLFSHSETGMTVHSAIAGGETGCI